MRVYNTDRLFFKKWVYKVETKLRGAGLIKRVGAESTIEWCDEVKGTYRFYGNNLSVQDRADLKKYALAVKPFLDKELQIRSENNTLSFFLNDDKLYSELFTAVQPWTHSLTEPANEQDKEFLLSKSSSVLCKEFPYEKYHFRVYLKTQMPANNRESFLKWLDNYGDKFRASKSTVRWLKNESPYMQDPFIYVDTKENLLMAKLFLGGYGRSTQEFVLRDSDQMSLF